MQQAEIHDFLNRFFSSSECELLPVADDHDQLKVKLTKAMDKLLMNRPFYWHYIEQIGAEPETAVLNFRFSDRIQEGEFIHSGSPRLHQILDASEKWVAIFACIKSLQISCLLRWSHGFA
ncbi:conserved protein YqhG [Sporolactobacillus inulinus]|uniref:Conserved protein YqhG n=1 Tax=Sporolactobacillus inulinus TaxID=2078 RepID=A0A4Y1Z844_9BACL|nr:conserved protein YqhG [Sporolactobacillus inulinus]